MALIIRVDAPPYRVDATTHPDLFGPDGMTLEALQDLVGGYIEHVGLHPPAYVRIESYEGRLRLVVTTQPADGALAYQNLVINEEGKLEGLPLNVTATAIAQQHGLVGDVIVGTAILLTDAEFK